jgi:hypothetical protein
MQMGETVQEVLYLSNPANQRNSARTTALPSSSSELSVSQAAILELKRATQTLFDIFSDRLGGDGQTLSACKLITNKREEFLILCGALRHDLQQGSICMEAYIVPLPEDPPFELTFVVSGLKSSGRAVDFRITEEEATGWKAMLPALVERCRRHWQHKSTCEYATGVDFSCPRTRVLRQSPICSCGQGEDVGGIPEAYSILSPYATKIAISPLSAVPYVEVMMISLAHIELAKVWDKQLDQVVNGETIESRYLMSCSWCRKPGINMIQCHLCFKRYWCSEKCERESREKHKEVCKEYTSYENEVKAPKGKATKPTKSFQEQYDMYMTAVERSMELNMSMEDYLKAFPPNP